MENKTKEYLVIYLSGDLNSTGYNPIGGKSRIKTKYGNETSKILEDIKLFLSDLMEFILNWTTETQDDYYKSLKKIISDKYNDISDNLVSILSNYILYILR